MNSKLVMAVLIAGTVLFNTAAPIAAQNVPDVPHVRLYPRDTLPRNSFPDDDGMTDLADFVKAVTNGRAGQVTGLYVPEKGNYYVVQQPAGKETRVSPVEGVLTQYRRPAAGGVIGLLAHNFAAGQRFAEFKPGDRLYLVYGDGAVENYTLTDILHYQAVDPDNAASDLIDQADGKVQSSDAVYRRVYTGAPHLVLQTCLAGGGSLDWGRLFLLADKVESEN